MLPKNIFSLLKALSTGVARPVVVALTGPGH